MKRALIPLGGLLALCFAVSATLGMKQQRVKMEPPLAPTPSIYPNAVAGVGVVEPIGDYHYLSPAFSGRIETVYVRAGATVQPGQPLVQLETADLKARLASAQAEILQCSKAIERGTAGQKRAQAVLEEVSVYLRSAQALADTRAISREELIKRQAAVEVAGAEALAADADVAWLKAALAVAQSRARIIETDLERCLIRAPIGGTMLKVEVHPGEFLEARDDRERSELVLGGGSDLRLRVTVDQEDAWRLRTNTEATALLRGNPAIRLPLQFLRLEPMIVPKKNLNSETGERVDTRVLQALYRVVSPNYPIFAGQALDVFVEAR